MPYNPNQPRIPAGQPDGGEWTKDQIDRFEAAAFKGARLPMKIPTVNSVNEIIEVAQKAKLETGNEVYIRWSSGYEYDKKMGGNSMNQVSGSREGGLSAQDLRINDPHLMVRMIQEYQFLRRKNSKIHAWILTGKKIGIGGDGEPIIDFKTVKPIAKISDSFVEKATAFNNAYMTKVQKYAYLTNGFPDRVAKNAKIDADLKNAWDEVNK